MKLTTHLHLVSRLKMRGAGHPLRLRLHSESRTLLVPVTYSKLTNDSLNAVLAGKHSFCSAERIGSFETSVIYTRPCNVYSHVVVPQVTHFAFAISLVP